MYDNSDNIKPHVSTVENTMKYGTIQMKCEMSIIDWREWEMSNIGCSKSIVIKL